MALEILNSPSKPEDADAIAADLVAAIQKAFDDAKVDVEATSPGHFEIRNEDRKGEIRYLPIPPCRFDGGKLRTFYHSDYFRSVMRHDDVAPFTEEEQTLLDLYEEIASREDLYLDMDLEPGDIQWLSNHTILHARTKYEDHPEPERKRHLLRLWLSLE